MNTVAYNRFSREYFFKGLIAYATLFIRFIFLQYIHTSRHSYCKMYNCTSIRLYINPNCSPSGSCSQRKMFYSIIHQIFYTKWWQADIFCHCCISQKGPNKNVGAAGQICCRILTRFSQKGPKRGRILKMFCFLNF
jgi:hypothetical protein